MSTPKKIIAVYKIIIDLQIKSLEDMLNKKSNAKKELLRLLKK